MSTNNDRGAKVRPLILDLCQPSIQTVCQIRQRLSKQLQENEYL